MVLHLRMVWLAGLSRDRAFTSLSVGLYWIPVHVTGIPPLEQQMLHSRGERYRDYQSRTSMFFPLAPQKDAQKGVVT